MRVASLLRSKARVSSFAANIQLGFIYFCFVTIEKFGNKLSYEFGVSFHNKMVIPFEASNFDTLSQSIQLRNIVSVDSQKTSINV